jgi:hypothetical protein
MFVVSVYSHLGALAINPPGAGASVSGLKDGLQCLHHCPYTTRAGLVQKIILLEITLSFGCVQVATI